MARPATVMRSRKLSWAPEDAEELADISVWQTARVGSVEEGGYQLFSKRAQELVTNSSLRFGTRSFAASKPEDGVACHRLSQRMPRRSFDMSSLETLTTRYDNSYYMETIQSPNSEILHPMRSLFLDKISSGSSPPQLSPKSEQPTSPSPEESGKNKDEHDQPPESSSVLNELAELEKRREKESEAAEELVVVTEDQRCLSESGEIASAGQEAVSPTVTTAPIPNVVMVVYDAERKPTTTGLDYAINNIVTKGDEIIVLGYLQHVMSPMGHKMLADATFIGVNENCLKLEMAEKKKAVEKMIDGRRQACEKRKVKLSSRVSPAALPRSVVVREAKSLHATWVILDRKALKENKGYYVENLNCHVLKMKNDGRSTETIRSRGPMTDLATSPCSASIASSPSSESSTGIDRVSNRSKLSPSFWSRFKSFGSHRRSSSVSHRSMSRSSSSAESIPSASIFNSTPGNTEYLDSYIPCTNGFAFNPAAAAAATHHQEVKIYSSSSKALLNLQVDPRVLAA